MKESVDASNTHILEIIERDISGHRKKGSEQARATHVLSSVDKKQIRAQKRKQARETYKLQKIESKTNQDSKIR
jgi:hypothetical protein